MQFIVKNRFLLPLLAVFMLLTLPAQADEYADAVNSFRTAGQSGKFFDTAYGYAIFPTIGKAGFIVGGAYGEGRVYAAGQYVGNTSMTQVSAGWQLGAQAYTQIVFFQNKAAFEEFTSGNFEFSAQATAVAITAGVSADASTTGGLSAGASGGRNDATTAHGGYRKGMAVFTIAKGGLMFEVTLGGQKFAYTPLGEPVN
ncbi:MAG: lipid-binding SYLF domain-containing protein [Pseudomonadota bacterium]